MPRCCGCDQLLADQRADTQTDCIGCKASFTGEAQVDVAAFLLATSPVSSGTASVSGNCTDCWNGLSDDELERAVLRVLRTFLPNAKFEDAP